MPHLLRHTGFFLLSSHQALSLDGPGAHQKPPHNANFLMFVSQEVAVDLRIDESGFWVFVAGHALGKEQPASFGHAVNAETTLGVVVDAIREIGELTDLLNHPQVVAPVNLAARFANEQPALIFLSRDITHDPLSDFEPLVNSRRTFGRHRQYPGFSPLGFSDNELSSALSHLVVIQFEGEDFSDPTGAIELNQLYGVIAISMEATPWARGKAGLRALIYVVEVKDALQEGFDVFRGGHILIGLGGISDLVLSQGVALEQIVSHAPLGKDGGYKRVMMQAGRGNPLLGPKDEVLVQVSLGELVKGYSLLLRPGY